MIFNKHKRIFVAGHRGMVGSAFMRRLAILGTCELLTISREELDLRNQEAVKHFLESTKPDLVIIAAAKVGGIYANKTLPVDFLYENLMIEANLIHGAHLTGVENLLFLGSNCVYPRDCPQPIQEDYLLSGPFESTSEPYAIAKIAGIKLCEAYQRQYGRRYFSVMPASLYGPNDNYDPLTSHVLPALIRKIHLAKVLNETHVEIWGSGKPRREYLYVDDLVDACLHLLSQDYSGPFINIGTGHDIAIRELVELIMEIVDFRTEIVCDLSKPDGTCQKLLDVSRLRDLGWQAKTSLRQGLIFAYEDFLKTVKNDTKKA